jgi:hypothetical protein
MTAITFTGANPAVNGNEDTWGAILNAGRTQIKADLDMLNATPTATLLGRVTAATGEVERLTGAQATTLLSAYTGDSGSGGVKGVVPAPAAGDAADRKVPLADGTWGRQSVFAFAVINSSTGAIVQGHNIASCTVGGNTFDVSFTDAAADANYTVVASGGSANPLEFCVATVSHSGGNPPTTAGFRVVTAILTITPSTAADVPEFLHVAVYR